jgi:hypothetical protein
MILFQLKIAFLPSFPDQPVHREQAVILNTYVGKEEII